MTNRMDTNPQRVPTDDRRQALIILSNDLTMRSASIRVRARDARGIVLDTRQPVCVLQQFYVRRPSRAHTDAHTHTGRPCRRDARAGTEAGPQVGVGPSLRRRPAQGPLGTVPDPAEARGTGTAGGTAVGAGADGLLSSSVGRKMHFPKHRGFSDLLKATSAKSLRPSK